MANKIVHQSKFRNIYGQAFRRQDSYEGIPASSNMFENSYCCVNPKFLAIATKAIGCFTVINIKDTGRQSHYINIKHSGSQLMDLKWNPFNDRMLATSADDGTIKIWVIPEDGLQDAALVPLRVISHHKKRVYNIEWHPSAENILASGSADHTAAVLDVGAASDKDVLVCRMEQHDDFVSQVCWDYEGERVFTFGKEQILRCFDARTGDLMQKASGPAHQQKRAIKLAPLGKLNLLASTGFSGLNSPELKIWDMENVDNCVISHPCGEGSGCLLPYFDADTNVLYVAARGEVTIRYFEVVQNEEGTKLYDLYIFNSQTSQKALCFMPKRGVDYMECEISRAYKLLNSTAMVEPVAFFVPRRAEGFQDDLYPDTVGVEPALTADQWKSGTKSGPALVPIQDIPTETSRDAPDAFNDSNGGDSSKEIQDLKDKLESQIKELETKLKAAEATIETKDEETKALEKKVVLLTEQNSKLSSELEATKQVGAEESSPHAEPSGGEAEEA